MGRVLALYANDPNLIPSIPRGPLSNFRGIPECKAGVTLEHCQKQKKEKSKGRNDERLDPKSNKERV